MSACERILELGRWAPSGDNTQPWRFELRGELELVVHGFDTRDHCVYDLDGHPSQMSLGALLETLRLAATAQGLATSYSRRRDAPAERPTFDVRFAPDPTVVPSPLVPAIERRVVQRRPLSTRPLSAAQVAALEESVGPDYEVAWFSSLAERWRLARLVFANAKLRLILPEAYAVHRAVIAWGERFSEDRLPAEALGADPVSLALMRFAMHSWERVELFNRFMLGTLLPRLQLDLLPCLRCAAVFALIARRPPDSADDYVTAGAAMQRFWLEATRQGLLLQPQMTPVIFARYHRHGRRFTASAVGQELGARVAERFESVFAGRAAQVVFLGLIGSGTVPQARSTRLPLARLMVERTAGPS